MAKMCGIGGLQAVVDDHAAALADRRGRSRRASSSRGSNAGGDDDHVDVELASPSANAIASTLPLPRNSLRVLVEVDLHAQRFDLADQHPRAGLVDLPGHQPRGELDDVRFQPQVVGRLGRFQAEQPAADDRGALRPLLP